MKTVAFVIGVAAGLAIGLNIRTWNEEKHVRRLDADIRAADDRCDDAAVGNARSLYAYYGGRADD